MLASTIKRIFLSFTFILVYSASSQAETITFNVTASGGAYFINGASRAELQLTVGNTYVFTGFSFIHPLRFSTTENGGDGVNYQDNVTPPTSNDDGTYSITIVVTEDTPDLFYYCQNHSGMGASISIALAEENVPAMGLGGMLVMGLLLTAVVRRANRRIS